MWAHVRRARALLEHVARDAPLTRLILRGLDVGSWQDARADWRIRGNRIRLRLRRGPAAGVYPVAAVRIESWGARLRIGHRRRPFAEEIQLVWQRPARGRLAPREDLLAAMRRWAERELPHSRVIRAEHRGDPAHTLSGSFPRLLLRGDGQDHLLLSAPDGLSPARIASILTQAILWRAHLAGRKLLRGTPRTWLLIPAAGSALVDHRARLLDSGAVFIRVCSRSPEGDWVAVESEPPEEPVEDRDFSWPLPAGSPLQGATRRIVTLAPELIQCYPRLREYDSLRIRGLEFARAAGAERTRVSFGIGRTACALTGENFGELQSLVRELVHYRRADSPSRAHPFYRAQAERWLECLLLQDAARLFPELLPGFTYPQIPVCLGDLQGRVDILSVDRTGRLVVMELKTAPDPDLPLQATDYWGRVVAHCRRGDFARRGYFPGLAIAPCRPRIYLVAPIFSFHDTTETVLAAMDPAVEVWKIGINEDWRAGVRVLCRKMRSPGTRVSGGGLPAGGG